MKRWVHIGLVEFWSFGLKEAQACAFAGSFFVVLALSRWIDTDPLPRYDAILLAAMLLQAMMLWLRLESLTELKAICLFHLLGLALEIFKTHPAIGSWSYPEAGYSKVFGVPLYSGFMYAAVASYMMRAWRLFDLELRHAPPAWLSMLIAVAIYLNFYTHHHPVIPDLRYGLALALLLAFWRTQVWFTPRRFRLRMPLVLSFVLIGFFVWVAENIATYFGAWAYPNQTVAWQPVHASKVGAWSLLVVMTFVIVADLKHYRRQGQRGSATLRPTDKVR